MISTTRTSIYSMTPDGMLPISEREARAILQNTWVPGDYYLRVDGGQESLHRYGHGLVAKNRDPYTRWASRPLLTGSMIER